MVQLASDRDGPEDRLPVLVRSEPPAVGPRVESRRESRRLRRGRGPLVVKLLDWLLFPVQLVLGLTRSGYFLLVMILMVMLVAFKSGRNVPFLMAMVMIAVLVGSAFVSKRALRRLILRRAAPLRTEAGMPFRVFLSISNAKMLIPAFAVYAVERLPGAPWLRPAFAYAEAIPAGGNENACYTLTVRRRGIYQFAQTKVESGYPFGLFRSAAYCRIPAKIVVYPRMMPVSSAFFEETDRRIEHIRTWRRTPHEEDFRGLREYRHGDNPKWIHWRTSAKLRKKYVRQFEKPESKRITMILETVINPRAFNPRRRAHLEMGVRFAASLGRECLRRHYEFTLLVDAPERTVVKTGSEASNIEELLDVLAALAPPQEGSVGGLLAQANPVDLRDAVVLVVKLGFAGVGEGADETLDVPEGVPEELFWEVTIGTKRFRRLFGRGVGR